MKGTRLWVLLSLGFSVILFNGCQKAAETTTAPAASPTVETINTAAIEAELTKLETDWPRIIKEKDVEAVKRFEADDSVFVYPDGSIGDKATDVKDMESGALSADLWEITDLKVTVLDKDAAIISGRSIVKGGKYKLPDGKTSIDISGQYRFIDTYARRNGEWKLVAGATTPVREPATESSPAPATKPAPAAAASPVTHPIVKKVPLPPVTATP